MKLNIVTEQVLALFLIIAVGYYAKKRNILNNVLNKGLTDLLLNISLPALIIISFNFKFSGALLINGGRMLLFSVFIHLASFGLGFGLYRGFPVERAKVLRFITVFSNCAYMGYPIIESVYGKIGIFYAAIFGIAFNIFVWTIGIMIFAGQKGRPPLREAFLNPGTIAVLIGLILFGLSLKLPAPVYKALAMIGSMTTPIAMILVGSLLADCGYQGLLIIDSVYYGVLVRLLILPLLTYWLLGLIGAQGALSGVCVLVTAMPAAANTVIFAEKCGADSLTASRAVFLSTVFSIFTIPLIILFLLK